MAKMTIDDIDFMVVLLDDGRTILGRSSCLHMKDLDKLAGEDFAVKDAKDKLWELEGLPQKGDNG